MTFQKTREHLRRFLAQHGDPTAGRVELLVSVMEAAAAECERLRHCIGNDRSKPTQPQADYADTHPVDHAITKLLVDLIRRQELTAKDEIIFEEFKSGPVASVTGYWIGDALDNTLSFRTGRPDYGVSLLFTVGERVVALFVLPAMRTVYFSISKGGSWREVE